MKMCKILCIQLILLLCILTAFPASASDTVDWDKTGSVSVTLKDSGKAVSGAEITLYRVADAGSLDNNLKFTFTDKFADFGGEPEKIRDAAELRRLADYTAENNINGTALSTDANGAVCFDGLSLGLYLAVQTGSAEGYSDCSSFLVSIPQESDGEWIYDIDATPKTDIVRLVDITIRKVWNDGGKNRPDSVTVQLKNGDETADTVTLNEQNGWSHTWEDMPESDAYSVKETDVPKGYTDSYQQNGYVYTVTNTSTLIQTGQLKWPIPWLAGAGLLFFAGGRILYFKGKRKDRA